MMYEIHNTRFLKPSELLHDLLVLQQIRSGGFADGAALPTHRLARSEVEKSLERLRAGEWVTGGDQAGQPLALTAAGEKQLRVLLVDYMRELTGLYNEVIVVFQHKLAEYYMAGVRRVAFYPVSDTAEVVHAALQGSGLTLAAVVDDDPSLWGAAFHGLTIQSPASLAAASVDGVICTTAVFEKQIQEKMSAQPGLRTRVLTLW